MTLQLKEYNRNNESRPDGCSIDSPSKRVERSEGANFESLYHWDPCPDRDCSTRRENKSNQGDLAGSVGGYYSKDLVSAEESWIDLCKGTGGAELAKAADEISLLDIYQAVECLVRQVKLFGFHDNPNPACPIQYPECFRWKAEDIQTAGKEMSQTTLKDVEDTQKKNEISESVS